MRRRAVLPLLVALLVGALAPAAHAADASATVQGRVTDAAGRGLAQICAFAANLGGDGQGITETDSDGRYRLDGLTAGTWSVAFSDCDPQPTYVTRTIDDVTVVAGQVTTVDATLDAGAFLTGTVTDPTGRPTPGICVHVVDRDADLTLLATTTTSRDGHYRTSPFEAGDVLVAFADCRPQPTLVGQLLGGGLDPTNATVVRVAAGATAQADVRLATGAAISGRVDDGSGAPHAGACLTATPPGTDPLGLTSYARSGVDGTFTLGALPAGTWRVSAGQCPGADDVATDVAVTAGQAVGGVQLSLPAATVARRAGADRVATAVAVADAQPSSTILLAGDASPADALAAAPLAAYVDAPLLLTSRDVLAPAVLDHVRRQHVTDAIVLGGTGAVSQAVADALSGAGVRVERIAGADRYATAASIAATLDTTSAYLVADDDWSAAAAIGALAAAEGRPILLTKRDELPDATAEVVGGMGSVDLVGGIDDEVAAAVAETVPHVGRIAGADRFDTSARVARLGEVEGLPWTAVWVTSGRSWSDALVAAAAAARGGGPLLLLSPATRDLVADNAGDIVSLTVVGGTAQVPAPAYADLAKLPPATCAATDRC